MLACSRYLSLDAPPAQLLHRLYATADRHGRFPAEPVTLALHAKLLRQDVGDSLDELVEQGFVFAWLADDGNRYGELVGWDDDAQSTGGTRSRAPSRFPHPKDDCDGGKTALCPAKHCVCPGKPGLCPGKPTVSPDNPSSEGGDVTGQTGGLSGQTPPFAGQKPAPADARANMKHEEGAISPRSAHAHEETEKLPAESTAAVAAFLEEYRQRLVQGKGRRRARQGPGFFGSDGHFAVERKLVDLWQRDARVAAIVCARFWGEHDEQGGDLTRGVERAIEQCAIRHGLPSALSQLVAMSQGARS